ncbi:putative bacterial hemoglobin [Candidatus Desulfarcum epimagneticum]|uniref:Putative bacterial hemoglobin n=1 Tax=uncultured Desulfobacteraceae bacterium TaxID=218296 RepID=A0A484HF09_9BACT|nr:putative bacterial hemoglobin [uncultured Desulfobacteraceae bacterium]
MTPTAIETVKATAPFVKEHGQKITQRMYEIAFQARPDLRRFFVNTWMKNPGEGRKQAQRLAGAVYAYASHIDDLEKLARPLDHIAHVHVEARIIPEMYPAIGECLLAAMKDVLGDAATPEVLGAWKEAYGALADILISHEREIYKDGDNDLFSPREAREL